MTTPASLRRYDLRQDYQWNYDHAPDPVESDVVGIPGDWTFCGLPVGSPLGMPAGPLLNGGWILYYAALGFDVLTYKTVRSVSRVCYELPNLQPVLTGMLRGYEVEVPASEEMTGSWAVSFGMPSQEPESWRGDIERTRKALPAEKLLSVSVVATIQDGWTIEDTAADYARCAGWAVQAGADCVETNFSCPNVSTPDGQLYQVPADAAAVAARVREQIGRVPLIVKIGHVTRAEEAEELLAAIAPFVDGVAMTNSVATTVRCPDGSQLFDGQPRGICGAATLEASLEQTRVFAELVERTGHALSLIGVGGAATCADVKNYLAAGAGAVHIATAAMVDPQVGLRIRQEWG